ncbi:MAG TPA: lycopene cyclase family protein [Sediminibacterium sp.]|nr:lycopene cyclase family protein [Sediminibacterium sp.]
MRKSYDYIIAGAGCAGLSLLMRMIKDPFFSQKKVLVIDASSKNRNDRTWCFWEKEPDIFEPVVHHRWAALDFFSGSYSWELSIRPYTYKMIRGLDFYNYVKSAAACHSNIHWLNETILGLVPEVRDADGKTLAGINLQGRSIYAEYVFSSILFEPVRPEPHQYYLQQHFKGWTIQTELPCFDPGKATFMDFRVSQEQGTTFMYMLPTSATTALVEYTLFTKDLLSPGSYDRALKQYISEYLKISQYEIVQEESGIIPMTNALVPKTDGAVVYIGIAGGQAKASSGYAFRFIQKRTAQITDALKKGKPIPVKAGFAAAKGRLYDSILLHVLHHHKMDGSDIFARIFRQNRAADVLAFLDNESSLLTDLKIMSSVPTGVFLPAALRELKHLL